MKSKLLFLIFILAGGCWSLIVIMVGVQRGLVLPYLSSPWASVFAGVLDGFMVAALGLRVYSSASQKELLQKLRNNPRRTIVANKSCILDPCQTAFRESYTVSNQRAR